MDQRIQERPRSDARASLRGPVALLLGRVVLVAAASVLVWAALAAVGAATTFPPVPMLGALAMLPVNIVCLLWVRRLVHAEGRRLRDLIGFSAARLGRDFLWGLLWVAVLFVPFVLAIMGVMALRHGDAMFDAFETVFFDPASVLQLAPAVTAVLALVAVLTFAPLNAPAEELVYRGYGQQGLARRMPVPVAIVVSAVLFGLQHVFYAPTTDAVLVYVVAFFAWGVGAGIIAYRQGRLLPIIIAHFLVNLFTSAPALVFAFGPASMGAS